MGRLPFSKSEGDLLTLFATIGPVVDVTLLRKPWTNEKKGAGFVVYESEEHAFAAVSQLDGYVFPGSTRSITVSLAKPGGGSMQAGSAKRSFDEMSTIQPASQMGISPVSPQAVGHVDGAKVFVGQLPFSKGEADLMSLFGTYGNVANVTLFRDAFGQKKGAGFVSFFTPDEANASLQLNGYMFEGATRPITVSIAGQTQGTTQPAWKKQNMGFQGYQGNMGFGGNMGYMNNMMGMGAMANMGKGWW